MEGFELPCRNADEVARVVRALGSHRYVAGRLHLVHAAAFDAAARAAEGDDAALLENATAWAKGVLADASIDAGSRDERLHRASTEKEVAAVLTALWGPRRALAHEALRAFLKKHAIAIDETARPFEEAHEEDTFPVLIDAGWELLPLSALDPERHRGAIEAFGEAIAFASARFEEESSIPPRVSLHELPAVGPVEALFAVDETGELVEPLVLWQSGDPTYLDYVLRGVLKASKL